MNWPHPQALSEGKGLYNLDAAKLAELRPDVILTQDICNVCSIDLAAVQRTASKMNPPPKIVSLDPGGLKDVLRDVAKVIQPSCPRARAVEQHVDQLVFFPCSATSSHIKFVHDQRAWTHAATQKDAIMNVSPLYAV
jgi:hypothetical protein